MLETLRRFDNELFIYLNGQHHAWLDPVMIALSDKYFWVPAYLGLIGYLIYQYQRRGVLMILMLVLAVGLADSISSGFFKPYFGRLRPCHDPQFSEVINIVQGCGGQFGFMSSHAANTFVLAAFLTLILPPRYLKFKLLLFLWAFLVSYSRIYMGVHFPADIVAGGLLGVLLGWLVSILYFRMERFPYFRK